MNPRTVSKRTLGLTWIALMALLFSTWCAARFNLGPGNVIIALLISGVKMFLVILIFMQVRYNSRLIWVFAAAGFVWWLVFISLTMTDYLTRKTVTPYNQPPPGVAQSSSPRT